MRPALSLLAALGLTATTVGAPAGLAQTTLDDAPAAIEAQERGGGQRGTDGQAAPRSTVGQAHMTSSDNPFLRGEALLRQSGRNETAVIVTLYGLEPGSEHVNHIHNGSCTGAILFPLEKLVADSRGIARSVSSVPGPINFETWWVNVHAGYSLPSPGVVCGDVDAPIVPPVGIGAGPRPGGGERPAPGGERQGGQPQGGPGR